MDLITHGLAGASVGVATSLALGDGSMQPALIGSTTVAALLPDLDFVFAILNKPLLAWRWHRVLLHNVFAVPLLAFLVACIANAFADDASLRWIFVANVIALLSHLGLDGITSFRSGFFFPLTKKRYAFGSHFLADPVIGILVAISLIPAWNTMMLVALFGYLLLAIVLKAAARKMAETQRAHLKLPETKLHLRPRFGAPWRWLAIIENDSQYVFFYVTPTSAEPPQTTSRGIDTNAAKLAEQHELLQCFASLADFPRYEDSERDGQPAIVVEDIQWWWKLPFRPMAMSAVLDAQGLPSEARESKKFSTSPTG